MEGAWRGIIVANAGEVVEKQKAYQHIPAAPTASKKQMRGGWNDTVHTNVLLSPG